MSYDHSFERRWAADDVLYRPATEDDLPSNDEVPDQEEYDREADQLLGRMMTARSDRPHAVPSEPFSTTQNGGAK